MRARPSCSRCCVLARSSGSYVGGSERAGDNEERVPVEGDHDRLAARVFERGDPSRQNDGRLAVVLRVGAGPPALCPGAGRALTGGRAIWVTSVRMRREDRSSISSSRRPRQVKGV